MAETKYKVLGERSAEVDDVRLVPGGEPKALTDEQVERLDAIGVKVEPVTEAGTVKPLSALKKPEAIARAEAAGIDSTGTLTEIVERLEQHERAPDPPPGADPGSAPAGTGDDQDGES